MNNIPYISIRSVLFDIALSMDEQHWDENRMLEWAIRGFRKISIPAKFQLHNSVIGISDHTARLPEGTRYIVQVAYKDTIDQSDVTYYAEIMGLTDDDPGVATYMATSTLSQQASDAFYNRYRNQWKPMKPSTSSFIKSVSCNYTIPNSLSGEAAQAATPVQYIPYNMVNCKHEYTVDADCTLTTTLRDGLAYVSYMTYPTNVDGDTLIPDDENLKEAIRHYCMYRYWESKSLKHEQASTREREWHLARYQTLGAKAAGALNMPDTGQMQVLLNINNRMIKSSDDFDNLFTTLGNHQSNNF